MYLGNDHISEGSNSQPEVGSHIKPIRATIM